MSLTAVTVGIENEVVYMNSIRNSFIKGLRTFLAYTKAMIHGAKN
jgi:hypothetical protein